MKDCRQSFRCVLRYRAILGVFALLAFWFVTHHLGYRLSQALGTMLLVAVSLGLVLLLGRLFTEGFAGLLHPRHYRERPQPIYSIPEARRKEGRYDEAWREYEKILTDHPCELRAYVEMLELAIRDMRNKSLAEAILRRALYRLA
ncbi:MAG: hypothetical protein N2255_04860, partial [Kiritimatiellae bacterium]|nr:hypothetical protein [Kiritimatiellia bacterium]